MDTENTTKKTKRIMTDAQRSQVARALRAYPDFIRSETAGDRVTLASLHYRGILERRAWRGAEGQADSAFEYRASDALHAAVKAKAAAARRAS